MRDGDLEDAFSDKEYADRKPSHRFVAPLYEIFYKKGEYRPKKPEAPTNIMSDNIRNRTTGFISCKK
jgi:hypothetical protein